MGGRGSAGKMSGKGGGGSAAAEEVKSQKVDFTGLPELEGTEKQVAWAEQIRSNITGTINDNIERMEKSENRDYYKPRIEAYREVGEKVNNMLRQPQGAKASNIINARNTTLNIDRIMGVVNDLEIKKRRQK